MSEPEQAATTSVEFRVNGEWRSEEVGLTTSVAELLRDHLDLHGTKLSCEVGVCGACTVLVDDRATSSCIMLAVQLQGRDVTTIEGLVASGELGTLPERFATEGGAQCGFCTSGQLCTIAALQRQQDMTAFDSDDLLHALHGNLCRCTGYFGILRALGRSR